MHSDKVFPRLPIAPFGSSGSYDPEPGRPPLVRPPKPSCPVTKRLGWAGWAMSSLTWPHAQVLWDGTSAQVRLRERRIWGHCWFLCLFVLSPCCRVFCQFLFLYFLHSFLCFPFSFLFVFFLLSFTVLVLSFLPFLFSFSRLWLSTLAEVGGLLVFNVVIRPPQPVLSLFCLSFAFSFLSVVFFEISFRVFLSLIFPFFCFSFVFLFLVFFLLFFPFFLLLVSFFSFLFFLYFLWLSFFVCSSVILFLFLVSMFLFLFGFFFCFFKRLFSMSFVFLFLFSTFRYCPLLALLFFKILNLLHVLCFASHFAALLLFPWMEAPQNGWFINEKPTKMDDLGLPPCMETSMFDWLITAVKFHWWLLMIT